MYLDSVYIQFIINEICFNFQFYYSLMIANGLDLTKQFAWINNDKRRLEMLAMNWTKLENLTKV